MEPKNLKRKTPEALIQQAIIKMLQDKDWYVESTHGNSFQFGFPDLYAAHSSYGTRWIEVKNPYSFSFTPSQQKKFPLWIAKRVGIWVLVDATETEYQRLFEAANLWHFWDKNCLHGYYCEVLEQNGYKSPSDGLSGDWKLS